MSFIKKGTTIVLALLLTLSVAAVLFSMAYYRNSFGRINSEIEDRDLEIERLESELMKAEENLTSAQSLLDLQIKRESNLSSLFTDIKAEKEKAEDDKKSTEGKLNQTQGELLRSKIDFDNLEYKYEVLNSNYLSLNLSYKNVLSDVDKICTKASSLNISQCKKYN